MPYRSQKVRSNRKKFNLSKSSGTNRRKNLNNNACHQTKITDVISHLESIGNRIINGLIGSERDQLKQQLLISCASDKAPISNVPFSSSKTSLRQILNDFRAFDCYHQRQYRSTDTNNNDADVTASATNNNQGDVQIKETDNNMKILSKESKLTTTVKRKKQENNQENSSAKTSNSIVTRTMCTRSSKLNNNQEPFIYDILTRASKRRSSLINSSDKQNNNNSKNDATTKCHWILQKTIGNDVSGVKISRKKLQASVPTSKSDECSKIKNDF